jgi:hypothetical protein
LAWPRTMATLQQFRGKIRLDKPDIIQTERVGSPARYFDRLQQLWAKKARKKPQSRRKAICNSVCYHFSSQVPGSISSFGVAGLWVIGLGRCVINSGWCQSTSADDKGVSVQTNAPLIKTD